MRSYDPVHWDPYMHAWVVTGYPEVIHVLMNYSSDRTPPLAYLDQLGLAFMKPFAEMMLQQMLFMDPPETLPPARPMRCCLYPAPRRSVAQRDPVGRR